MENQVQIKDVEPRPVWKRGLLMLLFVKRARHRAIRVALDETRTQSARCGLRHVPLEMACRRRPIPHLCHRRETLPVAPLAASLVDCAIFVLQMRITLTPPAPTAGALLFSV